MKLLHKLSWFFRLEKKHYLIGILSLILVSFFNLIPPRIMGVVIDRIDKKRLTMGQLALDISLLVVAALAMYALRFIWRRYIFGTANKLARILRYRLFKQFTLMSPSFYQRYRTGDLMAHATNDINAVTMYAGGGVMSAVDASVTAFVTLVSMFFMIDWRLTLLAILPLPFMVVVTSAIGRKNHQAFKEAQEAFSDLNNFVQESVSGVKVTKSFGFQTDEIQAFEKTNQMVFGKNMRSASYNALFDPTTLLFVGLSYVVTLYFGGLFVQEGSLSVGQIVTFITYLNMLVWPLQAMGFLFNISQRASVSYDRIEKLLAESADIKDPAQPVTEIQNGDLEYQIQSFAYEDEPVLSHIHFRLEKGQTLGIVGPTGSGKTTLLRLLLREHDLEKGTIFLNGVSLKDYRLKDLRGLIGYVPQDQILFAMTIRENVAFSDPKLSEEALVEALKICDVYEDILAMPDQLETLIGERGVSLSGGQKQRIAMSRALVMDPEILILDDSLSAVDAKTEHQIIENMKQNQTGKTTILTAHRLSAVVHADLILVMENGQIKERGNHESLMAEKGWYYETYQAQQLSQEMEGKLNETIRS
ncbi:ABC transporter ATP-binding protein [Streptococcus sp. IMAU 99161]|uniref:ABC transporter ATP-binding protein n=1 Tax=Streptococcus sp. IMAU 99161 TaxID=2710601 RepID=UPI0016555947|nr:ABC transporter transmembrane domain-containing protein [Streptococcus sp. IMAU 99161]MBC8776056.1 ATP-binding cassette domain-containing protein [Streptococcus sp. IMAU 99161]